MHRFVSLVCSSIALFGVGQLLFTSPAHAARMYWELGAGGSAMLNSAAQMGASVANGPGLGPSGSTAIILAFTDGVPPLEAQLGVQARGVMSSIGAPTYSLLTVQPVFRVQWSRLFLSLGVSPFALKQVDSGAVAPIFPAVSWSGELGYLWGINRIFSFGMTSGLQSVWTPAGSLSPWPNVFVTGVLRIYFRMFHEDTASGQHSSSLREGNRKTTNEARGWRDPWDYIH